MPQGKYIVIEGHDGTGKSTQAKLLRERLKRQNLESILIEEPGTDEPGGALIANAIRTVIKNGNLERDGLTNLLLFTAARHEIWRQLIKPALESGVWVIASRNYLSTLAYQGKGEDIDYDTILDLTSTATSPKYMTPDKALVLAIGDKSKRTARIAKRGALKNPDTFENKSDSFQDTVNAAYEQIAHDMNLPLIPAEDSREQISQIIWEQHISKLLS